MKGTEKRKGREEGREEKGVGDDLDVVKDHHSHISTFSLR